MLSKGTASYVRSLRLKKFRDENREFVAEGPKIISELISSSWNVTKLLCTAGFLEEHQSLAEQTGAEITLVSEKELQRVSSLSTPNQVLAVASYPAEYPFSNTAPSTIILLLDKIQDPGNLGTIIRTADWFGFRQIICSHDTVDLFNPKVVQSTMGSFLRVGVSYTDLISFLGKNKDTEVFGTYPEGRNIFTTPFSGKGIIIIGNESTGISRDVTKYVNVKVSIPTPGKGSESLNAAAAAAVVMGEFARKMHWP
jgi:TrmH family RNA methyltransferase